MRSASSAIYMTKTLAKLFGWILIIVGALGFIANPLVGMTGYFHANGAHNVVHIVLGLVLVLAAKSAEKGALWLKVVGVVAVLVAILGFMSTTGTILGFIETNAAANWLHLVLGVVFFLSGFSGGKAPMQTTQM
jgi:hypothetical protein